MKKLTFLLCLLFGLSLALPAVATESATPITLKTLTQAQLNELLKNDSIQQAQIAKLEKEKEKLSKELKAAREEEELDDDNIGIIICAIVFTSIFAIVFVVIYYDYKKKRAKNKTIELIMTTQQTYNFNELNLLLNGYASYNKNLTRGIITLAIGLAFVCISILGDTSFITISILAMFIGTGLIIIGLFQKKEMDNHKYTIQNNSVNQETDTQAQTSVTEQRDQ